VWIWACLSVCQQSSLPCLYPTILIDLSPSPLSPPTLLIIFCFRSLCAALELPFQPSMLHWAPGPKPYDGVWAPWWYANTHKSTGEGVW